jgi:hypothetical protein
MESAGVRWKKEEFVADKSAATAAEAKDNARRIEGIRVGCWLLTDAGTLGFTGIKKRKKERIHVVSRLPP